MKRILAILGVLVLILSAAVIGCVQSEPVPVPQETAVGVEDVKNAEIYVIAYKETVRLSNGNYLRQPKDMKSGTFEETGKYLSVDVYKEKIVFGDLNEDGAYDAVMVISSSGGGSGNFLELVVLLSEQENFRYFASEFLGDRVIVESILIPSPETILLNMVVHASGDPMSSPTRAVTRQYIAAHGQLFFITEVDRNSH